MQKLQGIIAPMVTALDMNRHYDAFSSRKIISYLLNKKIDALFVLGGVGEGVSFTLKQKREILEHVLEYVDGRVPILYNLSDTSIDRALEQYDAVKDLPIDYYVSTLPFYYHLRPDEEASYYAQLADFVNRPLLMYNLPGNVGQDISLKAIEMLAAHPNILGIKETTSDMLRHTALAEIKRSLNPNLKIFTGSPHMVYYALHAGFDGALLGISNVAPTLCKKLYAACLAGNEKEAIDLQARLSMEAKIIEAPSTISAIKSGLRRMGYLITDNMAMPYTAFNISDEQFALIKQNMEE